MDKPCNEYMRFSDITERCRKVCAGSEEVKRCGELFLPKLTEQDAGEYLRYKERALFFEGSGRTVAGLVGMLFAKEPAIEEEKDGEFLESLVQGYSSFETFLRKTAKEVIVVGRVGLLVDIDDLGEPYLAMYDSESIVNWRVWKDGGRDVLGLVVLRESYMIYDGFNEEEKYQYRVLRLNEEGNYEQNLYRKDDKDKEWVLVEGYPILPTKKGAFLSEIPFLFLRVDGLDPGMVRPPIAGLVNVNISHYVNSADLEHGRHFTGLPTAWVAGFPTGTKLSVGSTKAWVTSKSDAKAGYLEFTGKGLGSLENALKEKQDMMIVLGARLLEEPKKASESSDNQAQKKQGENSILANIGRVVSLGVTKAIKFAADWKSEGKGEKYNVEICNDFTVLKAEPQFLTALQQALQGGFISYETFFYNLRRAGLFPEGVTIEDEENRIIARQERVFEEGTGDVDES